jgi:hypothetical protein
MITPGCQWTLVLGRAQAQRPWSAPADLLAANQLNVDAS